MSDLSAMKGRSKPPSLLACIPCRKSHLKCNGLKPVCGRCTDRNGECIWVESRRGYRDYRKNSNRTAVANGHTPQFYSTPEQSSTNSFVLDPSVAEVQACTYQELFDTSLISQPDINMQMQDQDFVPSPDSSGSTTSITREHSPLHTHSDSLKKESTNLIDVFYKHFYPAHPFIAPRKMTLSRSSLLPEHLKAVMRFVAAHYVPNTNIKSLRNAASTILSEKVPEDGFKVQGLLLFALGSFARYEQAQGGHALELAIQIAMRIGMNRHIFALNQGQNNFTLQESWRRTWWCLFIINGLVTAIRGQDQPFHLNEVYCDVALPGPCEDYNNCLSNPNPRSLSDLRNRTFVEDPYQYSSLAYAIQAMYIMGSVFALGPDTFAITDPQVEAIDASISNFLLALPSSKRDVTQDSDGRTDEPLLVAHMIINWASILIHRPRSTLTFIRNHYQTTCTRPEPAGLPALAYASHTSKTLRAANALISLASIPRPLSFCTPVLMCGITTAATVHLPAYALAEGHDTALAIKERLQLCISALGTFAEIWPRANIAKSQVASFAREVLTKPTVSVDSTGLGMVPIVSVPSVGTGTPEMEAGNCEMGTTPLPQLEYGMGFDESTWMDSMISMDGGVDEEVVAANAVGKPMAAGNGGGEKGAADLFAMAM